MSSLKLFQEKGIRSYWDDQEEQWYFSVIDVVSALTDSANPRDYWFKIKKREKIAGIELSTICRQLKMEATDGKKYFTDCANVKGLFRCAILTAEISKATFGMTPSEYKEFKGLEKKNQNLRDHMTDLEMIFTMLGERVTTEISANEKPDTFAKNKQVAKRGGNVAGVARKETEKELGRSIISDMNYLELPSDSIQTGLKSI